MKKTRNSYFFIVIIMLLGISVLIGCSSEPTTETTKNEHEAVVIEVPTKVEKTEAEVSEETIVVEEVIVDEIVTEEPAEEMYIPEGIDMESTLPGEEWVASFVGNVTEPVVVIYNDNSGRKEVVQANSEVTINPDEDMIATYWPEKNMYSEPYNISVKETYSFDNYEIRALDAERLRSIPERQVEMTVTGGAEDWVIEFTIISE